MIALLAAATLTLTDWTALVDQSASAKIYKLHAGAQSDAHNTNGNSLRMSRYERSEWCDMERNAGQVATDVKKGIVLGTYEDTVVDDPKFLQSILFDWEQKEKDAHQKCYPTG